MSAQTAFAIGYSNFLKYCNPIDQLHRLTVANIEFILFRNKVHVDLRLGVSNHCGSLVTVAITRTECIANK